MFTGLIAERGSVTSLRSLDAVWRIGIQAPKLSRDSLRLGESIAVNGICLTVVQIINQGFEVEAVSETRNKTTLGHWKVGQQVNLERALKVGDHLDGHWVAGHIDCVIKVRRVQFEGAARRVQFQVPAEWMRYIAQKGSVALDGISLTVADISSDDHFSVALIPHTLAETSGEEWSVGQSVNLEVDLIARYLERLVAKAPGGSLTMNMLRSAGF